MEFKQIQELIKSVNKSGLSELSIKDGEFEIHIKQAVAELNYTAMPAMAPATPVMPSYLSQTPVAQPSPAVTPAVPAERQAAEENSNTITVKSPMIGTFYRSSGPDKPAFVSVGDSIKPGSVLCIVEAMKLFNEIESEVSGRIVKVLVDDASPVEYDQPLFLVEPE
ncbi:MAG TPA: acetyl-CoA carboxylase biotin carboxyl carrier protein [Edaphocola sp.]|nr:acetyl-CoA carboxylase biotin carboxyl carrier protein [Edaphocola sp.]